MDLIERVVRLEENEALLLQQCIDMREQLAIAVELIRRGEAQLLVGKSRSEINHFIAKLRQEKSSE